MKNEMKQTGLRGHIGSDRPLALTEPAAGLPGELVSEAEIRVLVDSFYEAVRRDEVLGPIFAKRVKDWSVHLPKMYDFWSTVVRRTGRYSGRPFETHQAIVELTPAHFERWLSLWEATVRRVFPAARHEVIGAFTIAARRMAASMSARLGLPGASG